MLEGGGDRYVLNIHFNEEETRQKASGILSRQYP